MFTFPAAMVLQGKVLPCFNSRNKNKGPLVLFHTMLSAFLSFLLAILLFEMSPKHGAEVLYGSAIGIKLSKKICAC